MSLALATGLGVLVPPSTVPGIGVPSLGLQPQITVWTNKDDDPFYRGERARVYFSTDRDAYVTIIRVDTDGLLRVLFPTEPWEDNFARGGTTFEVLGRASTPAFRIDDPPGMGYVFAVSSLDPFDFREISLSDRWDYRAISDGRVRGDPYVALTDLADRIAYNSEYDYDIVPYYVERKYDYPRFVCYDCHAYPMYSRWDPYRTHCTSFRIVIYDEPYYYPYRRYDGRRVVIVRPRRPGPRYVFKDADRGKDYVTRTRRPRTSEPERRRTVERDTRGREVGGRGSSPDRVEPRTRRPSPVKPNPGTETRDRRRPSTPDRARPMVPSTRPAPEAREDRRRVVVPQPKRATEGRTADRDEPSRRRVTQPSPGRTTRAAPAPSKPDRTVERRPNTDQNRVRTPDRSTRRAEPAKPKPRAEPRRSTSPSRVTPRRQPTRRAEPKRAEPQKQTPKPKSTGTPKLKRRKP
jgi:hypothetical protein